MTQIKQMNTDEHGKKIGTRIIRIARMNTEKNWNTDYTDYTDEHGKKLEHGLYGLHG
jgi:hypothetical protein